MLSELSRIFFISFLKGHLTTCFAGLLHMNLHFKAGKVHQGLKLCIECLSSTIFAYINELTAALSFTSAWPKKNIQHEVGMAGNLLWGPVGKKDLDSGIASLKLRKRVFEIYLSNMCCVFQEFKASNRVTEKPPIRNKGLDKVTYFASPLKIPRGFCTENFPNLEVQSGSKK